MLTKSKFSLLLILQFLFLRVSSSISVYTEKKSLVWWGNLDDFFEDGWHPFNTKDWGPGVALNKPTDLNEKYQPLNSNMTGNGVWIGTYRANKFYFLNNLRLPQFDNITIAKVGLKYYFSGAFSEITVHPCLGGDEKLNCYIKANNTNVIEWKFAEFSISVPYIREMDMALRIYVVGLSSDVFLLDEVKLSYENIKNDAIISFTTTNPISTEKPDACHESIKYKAVDCHNYYSCVNYTYKLYHECPREDGLAFNPVLGVCDGINYVEGCRDDNATLPNYISKYRPDPTNCNNYFYCKNINDKEEDFCELRQCPRGLLWSVDFYRDGSNVQQCNLPEKAICGK